MRRLNLQLFAISLNTGTSIVDYLKSVGQDSSFGNRQKLAKQYGISNYTGTADQNTKLLNMLKSAGVASANTTNTKTNTKTDTKTAVSTAAKSAMAGIANAVSNKVADIATKNTAKEPTNTGNAVKDASDYLVEATKPVSNSPNVSLPVSTGAIDSYIGEIVKGNIGLYSVPEEYQAEVAKKLGLDLPTESKPTFTPVETPTFNYTPQNTPTFTPVQTPTYTAPTTQAQQATPMKDRLDQATIDKMNSQFQASQAYTDAMNYTNQLLQQLGSGKTSYTDQLNQIMSEYSNRDKFSYNADSDPLFQQALASAMKSGSRAMSDTMGQAAALTGGYGSSYATSAGANAYNQFIDAAYDNLPEYYQIALDAYNQEGQSMLNRYNMLAQADSNEYNRLYNAYNANFNNAQTMYGNEYQAWADSVSNAYNYANMQNNEYWNQMNYDEGIRQYEQNFGYQQYLDQLNQSNWQNEFNYQQYLDQLNQSNADREFAYQQYLDRLNQSNWQNEFNYGQYMDQINQGNIDREFDYNASQDEIKNQQWQDSFEYGKEQDAIANEQWNQQFGHNVEQDKIANEQWDKQFGHNVEQDKIANEQWQQSFDHNVEQDKIANNQWQQSFDQGKYEFDASLTEDKRQFDESLKEEQRQYDNYVDRQKEIAEFEFELAMKEAQAKAEAEGVEEEEYKAPKEDMFTSALQEAVKGGEGGLVAYCDTVSDYDGFALVNYCERKLTFTKAKDTVNGFWGIDKNDLVTDGYGQTYKIEDVAKALGLSKSQQKKLTKLKEGEVINLLG